MTNLKIRKIPFVFDDDVPFQWHPTNPDFALLTNAIGVLAIGFERYIVAVMKQAKRVIDDPEVAAEADAFMQQEAIHARAHRLHMEALIRRYPGLQAAVDGVIARFDALFEAHPLKFHLGYIASLEATFTPFFKMLIDNRDVLFAPGDPRVASLFMWHFVEEIEHRSSALIVFNAVVRQPYYRLRVTQPVRRHVMGVMSEILKTFEEVVPAADRGQVGRVSPRPSRWQRALARLGMSRGLEGRHLIERAFREVPRRDLLVSSIRVLLSQLPGHDPAKEPLPGFADAWHAAYERGEDMTRFVGAAS
ncbi:MAG TPA: metal-dependent hydrolase [Nannocystis sp.]